ncbi:MAG: extracellular solute-binding protein, partial [Clostridia bacterium]|nr:extracellular solute-binding protein [Clostridia bacterium]
MKKLLALSLSVIMVLSMVCAAADDGVVLKVVAWDVNTTTYYAAQKEAFEASHPGITIEYVDVASQDYGTKTSTMLAGDDTSDIFMIKEVTDILNWNKA